MSKEWDEMVVKSQQEHDKNMKDFKSKMEVLRKADPNNFESMDNARNSILESYDKISKWISI